MNANVDAATMRKINRATVLHVIRDKRTTSRIDVAQITGLNKATVSYLVDDLIKEQLVEEIGYGSSSGGRKPVLLKFNANATFAIGVDVQISQMTTIAANTRGEIIYKRSTPISGYDDEQNYKAHLIDVIKLEVDTAIRSVPKSPYGIAGVGISLPGIVNFTTGTVYYLPNIHISNWDFLSDLQERIALPIFVDNDANCGAWCEYTRRNNRVKDLTHIQVGIGIGVGLIVDGKLYRGTGGLAGEFGHMTISAMGFECACGNYGCWEEYASERSLVRYIRESGASLPVITGDTTMVEHILYEAQHDNRAYIRAFHSLGQYLGIGIANIVNGLNPEQVTIGGYLSRAATFILPEVERVLQHRALLENKDISLTIAANDAAAVGAALIVVDHTLFAAAQEVL